MHRRVGPGRALALILLLEALLLLVDIALGPWTVVGFEEGRNARAAAQLACGHVDRLLDLQYRDFCGGCTAEAVVGAPLLLLLGARVAVWKLVPAAFHLGVLAAVGALAGRVAGVRGVVAAGGLMMAVPWAYRELALTGWGNHVESGALALGALWAAVAAHEQESRARRLGGWLLAGLLLGLGLWFCRTSAWAVVPIGLLAASAWRRGGGLVAVGAALGSLPLLQFYGSRPAAWAGEQARIAALSVAHPGRLLAWIGGDLGAGRLWPESNLLVDMLSSGSALALGLLGIVGLRRQRAVALGLLALVAAWVLRADLWADQQPLQGHDPFHWRYRAPAWPLLVIGAASLAQGRARWAIGAVVGVGLLWRGAAWIGGPAPLAWASVYSLDPTPDPTVPEGTPPVRQLLRQGRPADLAAAVAWSAHEDALPACHQHHVVEQGRRAGLGLREQARDDIQAWWASLPPADQDAAAMGLAWGLAPPGQGVDPGGLERARALAGRRLDLPLALRLGEAQAPDAGVACAARALEAVAAVTEQGRHGAPLPSPPPECAENTGWVAGLEHARRRWLGERRP